MGFYKGRPGEPVTGIMSDKKGGWRGCGKKIAFAADAVTVKADEPAKELKQ